MPDDANPTNATVTQQPPRQWRLGFWSLIATQFSGAFNENGLKQLVIFLVLGMDLAKGDRDRLVPIVGFLFSFPFILFSMTGGFLADRFSKRIVTIWTKAFEILIMGLALFALGAHNLPLELTAIFLASTQAAIFSPSKYGLLPELLPQEKLSWGNGIIELGTFLAIITGSLCAGLMADGFGKSQQYSGAIFVGCAILGLLFSYGISRVPAADPQKKFRANFLGDLWTQGQLIRRDRVLWLAVLGNTYFWFVGALLQFDIVVYGQDVLGLKPSTNAILQAAIAIGIGVGSLTAGFLSGGKIEYGLVPLGSVGMTVLGIALSLHGLPFEGVLLLLTGLGFFGGFFIVPINALIQHRPEESNKGAIIAAANWLSFIGIGAASAAYYLLSDFLHLGPASIFLWTSLATLAATAYVLWLLPDSLLRLLLWMLTHTFYRLDVEGREHVPARGGAMLAPNHVSMADAMFLLAALDRPVRFIMFKGMYEKPFIKPFAKILGVIPIASDQGPREMIHSLRRATKALQDGELVCIFPEGQMTRTGQLLPFRRGMERIIKGVDVPIIPVNLDGVWGSIFSFAGGRFLWKFPRHLPYPVRVTFGPALPPTPTPTKRAKPFKTSALKPSRAASI